MSTAAAIMADKQIGLDRTLADSVLLPDWSLNCLSTTGRKAV